ncbi:MAG TPA: hypothetical protein VIH90_01245 [Candidatus Saccharimonadales bacterium]
MAEKHQSNPEVYSPSHENHERDKDRKKTPEVAHNKLNEEQAKKLEQARAEIDSQTIEKDKVIEKIAETSKSESGEFKGPVSGEMKKNALKRELKHVRRHLPKVDQLGSKVIHQPLVKVISDASAKTITRPSGLLGGGIAAFIGSALYYYFTKHIGVNYNYLLFISFFVAGFAIGLIIELIVWSSSQRNKSTT